MASPTEIYAKINEFLDGHSTLNQLETWLAPHVLDALSPPDSDLAYDVSTVELCLAEIADGIRSPRGARRFLRTHLRGSLVHRSPVHSSGLQRTSPVA